MSVCSRSSEEFVASDNESEAETGVESNRSEGSDTPHVTSRIRNVPQRRHSSRKRQRPSWYSDEDEEESGEEEEDEIGKLDLTVFKESSTGRRKGV